MTGTERKVFQKYYPPDYDPSKLRKVKGPGGKRNRQFVQRVMTPCNMQCNTCHEYIYKGKKFNMKRETAEGENYLGLAIFRFYFRCPNCLAEITFKTDLENTDYQMEQGATRLFEAFKLHKDAVRAEEAKEEEDKKDPMKMLEKRTMMSRAEMEAMGALEDLQEINRGKEGVDIDRFINRTEITMSMADQIKHEEERDEELIRTIFHKDANGKIIKRLKEEDEEAVSTSSTNDEFAMVRDSKPVDVKPPIEQLKRKNDQRELLSKLVVVKRNKPDASIKQEPPDSYSDAPTSSKCVEPRNILGLADYGSDSGSD